MEIIISLLAGFAAGVLFAPAKGTDTRRKISEGVDKLADSLSELAEKIKPDTTVNGEALIGTPKTSTTLAGKSFV